ncbi:MAG: hypothetical protein H8E57_10485 [Candidatus Cloacimonetes bacterium]|nr:hypothetical protein [Candidatus Cloacimonadota bacterium]
MKNLILLVATMLLFVICFAQVEVPQKISFQGKLSEDGELANGTKEITFTIGEWTETHEVEVNDGIYSVMLGSNNPIPIILFDENPSAMLQITIEGVDLTPDTGILTSPYAFKSETSAKLDGHNSDYYLGIESINGLFGDENRNINILAGDNIFVESDGNVIEINAVGDGTGTVTSITEGEGIDLDPDEITDTGSVSIADDGVTTVKLADESVNSAKISDGAIVNTDISNSANISASKIQDAFIHNTGDTFTGSLLGGTFSGTHTGNGSGLTGVDASELEGQSGDYYLDWNNLNNVPAIEEYTAGDGIDIDDNNEISATLGTNINSSEIENGTIVNTDISNSANISASKLNDGSGSGLDADKLDGKESGNSANQIPVNNGTVCTNLNADKLDGHNYSSSWEPDGYNSDNAPGSNTRGEPTGNEIKSWADDISSWGHSNVVTNLNADKLDDMNTGTNSGNIAYYDSNRRVYDSQRWGGSSYPGGTIWTSNNDGSGSGLDADKLDGQHASSFLSNPYSGLLESDQFYANSNNEYGFKAGSSFTQYGFWAQGCDDAGFYAANVDGFGFHANNNDSWGFYASNNYGGYGGQTRGRGILLSSDNDNIASASFHNNSNNSKGLFIEGSCHSTGSYTASVIDDAGNEKTTSTILSPSQEIITYGTSTILIDTEVEFEDDFSSFLSDEKKLTVTVTPVSDINGILIIKNKTKNGFQVSLKEIPGMTKVDNAVKFDWIAIGRVTGYEKKEDLTSYIKQERQAKHNMIQFSSEK